jgi:hypothetical protein
VFQVSVAGSGFDLDDFKTMARINEDLGVGLRLGDDGSIHAQLIPAEALGEGVASA